MIKNGRDYLTVKKWGKVTIDKENIFIEKFHFDLTKQKAIAHCQDELYILADAIDRLTDLYAFKRKAFTEFLKRV